MFHSAPQHYHQAMHIIGLLTTADTIEELDAMVESTAVVFSSIKTGTNVKIHFAKLQSWLQRHVVRVNEASSACLDAEDIKVNPTC